MLQDDVVVVVLDRVLPVELVLSVVFLAEQAAVSRSEKRKICFCYLTLIFYRNSKNITVVKMFNSQKLRLDPLTWPTVGGFKILQMDDYAYISTK